MGSDCGRDSGHYCYGSRRRNNVKIGFKQFLIAVDSYALCYVTY